MNKGQLLKLIQKGESQGLEFKSSLSRINEIIESIAALSSAKGGRILIGISRLGKILGVQIGKDTIERLANKIRDNTEPKTYPEITIDEIDSKKIIIIEVKEAIDKPVLAFGRAFKRVGKSTLKLSKDEYERIIVEKRKVPFDSLICEEATIDDINWDFVESFFVPKYEILSETKLAGGPEDLLEALGCIKNNKPTNAGILLFGEDPQKVFMNAFIALARYKGKKVGTQRLDYKEFDGNLFRQIDNCDRYIKEHMAVMSRLLPDRVEREDIPEYSFFAIRELIVNAACHRDYSEQGSKVIIKMFDDHIEYYNPGGLPRGITPKNILRKQFSRNPVIARVLAKVRYIEEIGEGWDKIIKEHKEHSLKPRMPEIISDACSMTVNIFSTKEKFEGERIIELNERQKKALEFVGREGRITNKDYRKLFPNITSRTVLNDLTDLIKKGVLQKVGKTKGAYYIPKIRK